MAAIMLGWGGHWDLHAQTAAWTGITHPPSLALAHHDLTWSQGYTPLGRIGLSALVAALPVITLLGLLAFWHVRAHLAALVGLLMAAGIAVGVYGMPPLLTAAAAGYGVAFGLFPIGWIVLNAIFIYVFKWMAVVPPAITP